MAIPGNDGVLIWRPRTPEQTLLRDLLLVVWRPCALYLLVTTAIAIPGLIVRFL